MKKSLLVSLLLAAAVSAHAAAPAEASCAHAGYALSWLDGDSLSGGIASPEVAGAPIALSYTLSGDGKVLARGVVSTRDGEMMPVEIGAYTTYTAAVTVESGRTSLTPGAVYSGLTMAVTPTLGRDGRVEVAVAGSHAELSGFQRVGSGATATQVPNLRCFSIKETVALDGGEARISFTPTDASGSPKDGYRQYTLSLAVSK